MKTEREGTRETELAVLKRRARELAARRADDAGSVEREVVVFTLGEERYAVESAFVLEIFALTSSTSVPGAPAFLSGVTSLRGEILALVDLRHVLRTKTAGLSDLSRVIVLGKARPDVGLIADRVESVEGVARVAGVPASLSDLARDFVQGILESGALLLDGERLLQDERLWVSGSANVSAS